MKTMEINNYYDYICEMKGKYPQLSHASNIITKYSGKLNGREEDALTKLIPEYSKYLQKMMELSAYDKYAIYRTFDITINGKAPLQIRIPAIAIEAKTYIDKTMLDSIIATAEKIKSGNPHTRFIAVSERYDVCYAVDPAYSRIDQIYILRKLMRKNDWADVDKDVVWRLFEETTRHLEKPWSDIEARIREEGVVI